MLLKITAVTISEPLARILNISLETGTFPRSLRDTRVIPLYKRKGDRNNAANYRPVCLIDYLSKVFERVIRSRMQDTLERSRFFSPAQYGFRGKRSTELALARLWNNIAETIEEGGMVLGVFLDLSSAFNCLSHELFLAMLGSLGC